MSNARQIFDKTQEVIFVSYDTALNDLWMEAAKSLGLSSFTVLPTISDAFKLLETKKVSWLFIPLTDTQESIGLQALQLVTQLNHHKQMHVTLLINKEQDWCLQYAFEHGLFSYLYTQKSAEDILSSLSSQIDIAIHYNNQTPQIAAHYLREYLTTSAQFEELVHAEKCILDSLGGTGHQLLKLANAYFKFGDLVRAKNSLEQALLVEPALEESVEALRKEIETFELNQNIAATSEFVQQNVFQLKNAVIIDPDEKTRQSVRRLFVDLGITEVQDFQDGRTAYKTLMQGDGPSLIIMEWRLGDMSGPVFLQRIRSLDFHQTQVIILSNLVNKEDLPIIKEMGVTLVSSKPIIRDEFIKVIVEATKEFHHPTLDRTLEEAIRSNILQKRLGVAERDLETYKARKDVSEGKKYLLRSELALAMGQYEEAKKMALEASKTEGNSLFLLNALGRALMMLRDFAGALACLERARNISPQNLEHLVLIAEIQADSNESEIAAETLQEAKNIDPESKTVHEGELKVAIATGNTDLAKNVLLKMEGLTPIISYLNNKAIAWNKVNQSVDAIELYNKLLSILDAEKYQLRSIILFNKAIALIRSKNLNEAKKSLDEILSYKKNKVTLKADDLLIRLGQAIKRGDHSLQLKESDAKIRTAPSVSSFIQNKPGEIALFLIYKSKRPISENLQKLLDMPFNFEDKFPVKNDTSDESKAKAS